jgi:outer membrane lipoprotein-sorting protein
LGKTGAQRRHIRIIFGFYFISSKIKPPTVFNAVVSAPNPARIPSRPITRSAQPRDFRGGGGASHPVHRYIHLMNRRTALLAPLFLAALTIPALAEKVSLAKVSDYLNSLTTLEADFTQVNADGTIATGRIFIKRPGRVRFEYAPPDRSLVIAGGQQVAIFDAKSNQPPEQYPLKRTPLNLILAENIDLGRTKMVVGHTEDGTTTRVRAQDPENPEYGSIELVFTADPVELRQWVIIDDLGAETTVILGEMKKGGNLGSALFDITAETAKRQK